MIVVCVSVEAPPEPPVPTRANQKGSSPLRAVKEDPAMSDADVVVSEAVL